MRHLATALERNDSGVGAGVVDRNGEGLAVRSDGRIRNLVSAAVGFIALSGVALLDGLVMVSVIHDLVRQGVDRATAV